MRSTTSCTGSIPAAWASTVSTYVPLANVSWIVNVISCTPPPDGSVPPDTSGVSQEGATIVKDTSSAPPLTNSTAKLAGSPNDATFVTLD